MNRCQPLMTSLWVLPVLWVDVSLHRFHLHLFQFDQYQSCNEMSAFNDSSFYQSSSRVQWLQFATSSNLQCVPVLSVLWEADHSDRLFCPVLRVPEIVSLMPEFYTLQRQKPFSIKFKLVQKRRPSLARRDDQAMHIFSHWSWAQVKKGTVMYEFGVIRFGYNPDINGRDHSDTITNLVSWLTLLVTEFVLQL